MARQRERTVISHMSLVASPRLIQTLDEDARREVGRAIWMCTFWTLLDARFVGHDSDITQYFDWMGMVEGSNCYVDLGIKAVVTGFEPDAAVKQNLNGQLFKKLSVVLGTCVPIQINTQARFVWGNSMSTRVITPTPDPT